MRFSVILLCLSSLGAYAQTIFPGQTRQVISSAAFGANVGSPLLATPSADLAGWTIVGEVNPAIGGVGATELFFAINNNGQLTVLQDLERFFPAGSPFVTITLTVRAFFDPGGTSPDETVTITVVEDTSTPGSPPSIPTGLSRNVVVQSAVGASVGSPLFAANTPSTWSIVSVNNHADVVIPGVGADERFFDINNTGQITVLQTLERFFNVFTFTRGEQVFIEMVVQADNAAGVDTETVRIYIIEGTEPAILSTQSITVVTDVAPGTNVGDPLQAVGDPTYWTITDGSILDDGGTGFNAAGAFTISPAGQLSTTLYLDQFFYSSNPFSATLTVVCGSQYGESTPTVIPIEIVVVGSGRCGSIPATQTRYIRSNAVEGDTIGDPIDSHGVDSLWIEEAWIDGNIDVASFFTIRTNGGTLGQMEASRAMSIQFPTDAITKVEVTVRGHVVAPQCPGFIDEIINVYVLPSDATTGGGGGGTTSPDFSAYIDDATLLACIRQKVGLVIGDPLTADQVLGLTELDCACRNDDAISDLDGLHLFTSLTQLNLANNLISDIRPLASLEEMTDLRLAGNLISDITTSNPLASMTGMSKLDLSFNQIRDTNAFSTMTQLNWISLANNNICDVASLVALANNGALTTGDTVILDENHLLTTAGQSQISVLQNSGAFVSLTGNDGVCPPSFTAVQLQEWPETDVRPFADIISTNWLLVPCND